jgi:hypothetical protein
MGVPTSEVDYTSARAGRGDREVHKEHVVTLAQKIEVTLVTLPRYSKHFASAAAAAAVVVVVVVVVVVGMNLGLLECKLSRQQL